LLSTITHGPVLFFNSCSGKTMTVSSSFCLPGPSGKGRALSVHRNTVQTNWSGFFVYLAIGYSPPLPFVPAKVGEWLFFVFSGKENLAKKKNTVQRTDTLQRSLEDLSSFMQPGNVDGFEGYPAAVAGPGNDCNFLIGVVHGQD